MQNSSLHSFSLRLHFHAQYLQNKVYKHLMAKILPEQSGYLALLAPSHLADASKVLVRNRGWREVTHANPIRRSSLVPRRADTTRFPRAAPPVARAGDTGSGAAPPRFLPAPGRLLDGTTPPACSGTHRLPDSASSPVARKRRAAGHRHGRH